MSYVDGLFIPGLRRAGDFRAVATLLSDASVLLHNGHEAFPAPWFQAAFAAAGRAERLKALDGAASTEVMLDWLGGETR